MTTALVWFAFASSYLVLAGQFSLDEVVAAFILGALGAAWQFAVVGPRGRRFSFDRDAARAVLRAIGGLPRATTCVGMRLAASLFRPVAGRSVERRFLSGSQREPADSGRRAAVVLATSLAPDSYVLRVPIDEDTILCHALTDRVTREDPRWPS